MPDMMDISIYDIYMAIRDEAVDLMFAKRPEKVSGSPPAWLTGPGWVTMRQEIGRTGRKD